MLNRETEDGKAKETDTTMTEVGDRERESSAGWGEHGGLKVASRSQRWTMGTQARPSSGEQERRRWQKKARELQRAERAPGHGRAGLGPGRGR
jgi:hypothetical protein